MSSIERLVPFSPDFMKAVERARKDWLGATVLLGWTMRISHPDESIRLKEDALTTRVRSVRVWREKTSNDAELTYVSLRFNTDEYFVHSRLEYVDIFEDGRALAHLKHHSNIPATSVEITITRID